MKSVVGSFNSFDDAAGAARGLRAAGFLESDVNVVANDVWRSLGNGTAATMPATDEQASAAATSVVAGCAVGSATGFAVSLLGLTIPGLGPILAAGPIAAALAGSGIGAVAGGLIGGLTDLGITPSTAAHCVKAVCRGAALVTVSADASRVHEAETIMRSHEAFDIEDSVQQWRSAG